jgi:hypothetical protein
MIRLSAVSGTLRRGEARVLVAIRVRFRMGSPAIVPDIAVFVDDRVEASPVSEKGTALES